MFRISDFGFRIYQRHLFLKRYKIYDVICFIFLLSIGLTVFSFLFNSQPFIYDDNSFHYFSLHYAVIRAVPVHHRLVDWNPYWFAGIPELQFYPPGSILSGIVLYYLTLTLIPIGQIYNLILLFALLFPALTSCYLLRKAGFHPVASFFTGLYILILLELGYASGVFYGVLVGLTNSRIALGFYPLILWFGIKNLIAKPRKRNIAGLAILLGISLFCHPYHIFLPFLGLIAQIYAFKRTRLCPLRHSIKTLGLAVLLGIGLSAFWWFPLFIRHNYVSSLQIWSGAGTANQAQSLIGLLSSFAEGKTNLFFLCLYLISALSLLNPQMLVRQRTILAGLVLTPLLMLIFLVFVQIILIPFFHFYFLDVVRLKDGFFFSVILTSGIGIYELIAKCKISIAKFKFKILNNKFEMNGFYPLLSFIFLLIILAVILGYSAQHLWLFYDFPQGYARTGFLPTVVKEYQLDELWSYLKNENQGPSTSLGSSRILFTASSLRYKELPAQFQTHIMSLTPIYTYRQIIGGLNTPFYTVASYLFFGKKAPIVIRTEADSLDNKSLLGIPWEQMEQSRLTDFCKKLNITTIVTNRNENKVIEFFNRSSAFRLEKEIDEFNIYTIPGYQSSWLDFDTTAAKVQISEFAQNKITFAVTSATTATPILIKLAYYPCWKATSGQTRLPITANEIGLMQLTLPQGEKYQVELVYRTGWVEKTGWTITLFNIFALIASYFILNRKKAGSN